MKKIIFLLALSISAVGLASIALKVRAVQNPPFFPWTDTVQTMIDASISEIPGITPGEDFEVPDSTNWVANIGSTTISNAEPCRWQGALIYEQVSTRLTVSGSEKEINGAGNCAYINFAEPVTAGTFSGEITYYWMGQTKTSSITITPQ